MPLVFKKSFRDRVDNVPVFIDDKSTSSPNFFRVTDVPQVLTKGKNLIKISGHPTNLKEGTQIYVDVRDSNGNPIYYEIPDYIEEDKSRVISIWVYHDKGDDNTPNGEATITLVGIATKDGNGNPIPNEYKNKLNVRWQVKINVDRDRSSTTPIIFNSAGVLPSLTLSESIETYQNQPQAGSSLNLTSQSGKVKYILRGKTAILQITDGSPFNEEMNLQSIVLSNYTEPATPISRTQPTNLNFFSGSISKVLSATNAQLSKPYTASFQDREGLIHTYNSITEADYNIQYFRTGSNISTENQRSFVNISFDTVDPIVGVVDKIKVLQKSDGLPGEFELLNEVAVPFSSSFSVKIPMPSENLQDPKLLKIQYLNSIGEISRTETTIGPFVFQGGNFYFGGSQNLISGSIFISNQVGTGIEIGGASSGFLRSVGFNGQTSASLGESPGGFIIYSGSGNLQVGADVLEGVGMQFIGNNDERHFIFTTHDGGNLDIKTDKFFIGTTGSQFISGSDNNIEISSSLFHLDPKNDLLTIGADAVIKAGLSADRIFTPATIGGSPSNVTNASSSITADGFAKFTSASIAGFVVNTSEIKSSDESLRLKADGNITASKVLLSGGTITDNVTILGSVSANSIQTPATIGGNPSTILNASSSITDQGFAIFKSASIAGFDITPSQIKSVGANPKLQLKSVGQITASDGFLFGNKGTDNYVQFIDNTLSVRGDLTVDQIFTPATIGGVSSNITNASSSIKADGFAKFVSASIGGWGITTGSIEGGNLIMKPEGILQTKDFASNLRGWKISSEGNGTAEFENVRIRGTLRTTTFEKESVNAVGGQLWVTNATTLTGSNITANETTMSVKNASGFAVGEILLAKKVDGTGFQTEYLLIESASIDGDNTNADNTQGRIYVQRGYGSGSQGDFVGDLASTSQSYDEGQVIVSTGLSGSGYIKMNANPKDTSTPFIDIVERTGSGLFAAALKARLGDLSGLANSSYVFGNPNPGFGLATDNVFLQGGIIARTGSIAGINMNNGRLFTGEGTYSNSNTGFYVDSGSQFSLGNKLIWNPTTEVLQITGQIQLSDGTDVGGALAEATSSNTAKTVTLGASSYVITFNPAGTEDPAGQSITLTATQQNHSGTVYYEFYKGASLQGARGTTNTFTVDQSSEKPTSTTPVTYEVRTFEQSSGGSQIASDSLTLFGVKAGASGSDGDDGADGSDGVDAVTAFLTNEAHTFAANPDKSIVSFTGGTTDMIVFEGVTDKTTSYTYSRSSTTSVSSSISDNTITVTSMGHDSGSIIITATSASTSLSKTMTLTKAVAGQTGSDGADGAAGLDGTSAKTLVASIDSQVMAFDDSTDTSATPTEVVFSFNQQNLNAAIGSSDITISTAGGEVTNFGFDNNSVTNSGGKHSGISSGSISFAGALNSGGLNSTKSNLPVTISVTKDGLSDSIKVFKVEGGADGAAGADGTDAVTTFLTNESHTFTAQSDGTIISFVGGSTDMEVFEGVTNRTSNYTISSSNGVGVTATDSGNTVTVSAMTHDSGSVTITATSASVSLSKTMSLTKSKQGTAGLAGSDAKILSLSTDSQVFSFPSASSSTAIDDDILITINQQNLSGQVGSGDLTIVDSSGTTLSDPTLKASVTDGSGQVSGSITFSGTVSGDKTKLPLTITVSKDSLEDTIKIFKVEGGTAGTDGAAGADGADAVTAFLTNESHTFPADSSGSIASFVGGSTEMEVFEGVTNRTSNYTISSSNGVGVTATDDGNTVTISGLTHDSGSVTITATSASVSLSKTMSLTKARQGSDGSDGTSAKLLIGSLDSQVFSFLSASDSTADPSEVFFSFQQQNLTGAIVSGDITISTAGGSNITNFDFNNADVSNGTGIVSGSIVFSQALNNGGAAGTKSNLPITISATKDGLQDSVKIFKVEGGTAGSDGTPGEDARVMILTNESHTFAAQPNGNIISFTGGDTDVSIFKGITDTTSNYTISAASTTSVSSSVSSNTVTVTSMGHDSGSVVVTATSASVSLTKLFSLTKAKQGEAGADGADGADGNDGLDGSSAKILTITSDSQVFGFDNSVDTTATPSSIIFTVAQQNLSHTIDTGDITITKAGGSTLSTPSLSGTVSSGTGQQTFTVPFSSLSKSDLPLTVSVSNNAADLTDSTKIFKVQGGDTGSDGLPGSDGTDAVTTFLTNEAHTFAAQNDGTIVSFVGASTDMEVFEGVTNKTSLYTISASNGLGVSSSLDGNTVSIGSMSHDSGSVSITATSASVSLSKTMSLVKSKQGTAGLAGSDAKLLTLSSDSMVFSFPSASSSTAIDDDILLIINQQNLSGTVGTGDLTIVDAGGVTLSDPTLKTSVTDGTGEVSGSITFSSTVSGDKTKLPLTVTVSKDSLSDTIKIFKVEGGTAGADGAAGADGSDGADAVTAFLTNESHTFPADSTGAIASFTGGTTDMEVFEGVTNKTTSYTISRTSTTSVSSSITDNTVTVTSMAHDSGSIIITATSASVSLSKTMSLTKARQGADGSDGTSAKLLVGSLDSQVFSFLSASDNTSDPSEIIFSFNQQNLSGTIGSSDITISTAGGNVTNFGFDNNDVSSGTGVVSGSISFAGALNSGGLNSTKSNLPVTITATKDSLSDSIKIFKVEGGTAGSDGSDGADGAAGADGVSAVTAFLTNDSHTLPLSSSNTIISFTGASTDIEVFEGTSNKTSAYTVSQTTPSHFTTTLSGKTLTITSGSFPHTGSIVLTATSASVSLAKTMSISIARQGDDGADGSSAKSLSIVSDSQTFAFDNSVDTTATPTSIAFTVNQQNLSGTIGTSDITITKAGGSSFTTPSLGGSVSDGSGTRTFSLAFSSFSKTDLPLSISVSKDSLSDSTKIFKVQGGDTGSDGLPGSDGVAAVTAFLTNESHTFAADFSGSISSFVGGSTDMEVFEGVTNSTNNYTISAASTTSVSSSTSGNTVTVTSMGHDSGSVVITATSASVSLSKTMSLVKSKQGGIGATGAAGAAGTNAKVVSLLSDKFVITYNGSDVETPSSQTITLTADEQNHSGTVYYQFLKDGVSQQNSTSNTFTINTEAEKPSPSGSLSYSVKTREGTNDSSVIAQDSVSIFGVKAGASGSDGSNGSDGVSAITSFLTSDGDIVPAANDGTVSSFNGTGTTMKVFQGATDVTSDYTYTVTNSTGLSTSLSTNVLTITALTPDSGSATITATSASGQLGQVQISKTYSIGKSKQGDTGPQGPQGDDNQDFSWANESLTGVGPIGSAGLLMTSNVFGFHNGIAGANGSLDDFTAYLDSSGNFFLGSGSTDAQLVWDNINDELLISGSKAKVEVDQFFIGKPNLQFISGSNGNIEISSSKFHVDSINDIFSVGQPTGSRIQLVGDDLVISSSKFFLGGGGQFVSGSDGNIEISSSNFHLTRQGNVTMSGIITAEGGNLGGFTITDDALSSTNFFMSGSATGNQFFISSSNFNVKANGDVTASDLNLTGGKVGGLGVTSGEVAVGEILKLKESGQITGSSVLFSGGNIGGFQLENSSLFQSPPAGNLEASASFRIRTNFGDYGNKPPFEFESRISGKTFYIDNISTNLPTDDLSLILTPGTYLSGSQRADLSATANMFQSGSSYYDSTVYTVIEQYNPKNQTIRLRDDFRLSYGADSFFQPNSYNQRDIFAVNGVSHQSSGGSNTITFNESGKSTSFTITPKDLSNLILSSSGAITAEVGNLGGYTIKSGSIELIDTIEDRDGRFDFRVYIDDASLPSIAISQDQASDNSGNPLQLYYNNEFLDVHYISNAGSNGSDEGFGYYLAISESAATASSNFFTKSELASIGGYLTQSVWPYTQRRGYGYIPRTINEFGRNETWYLKYFSNTSIQTGETGYGGTDDFVSHDFTNAGISFLSQSIQPDLQNRFHIYTHTASLVGGNNTEDPNSALWLRFSDTAVFGAIASDLDMERGNYVQALLVDGGGTKLDNLMTTSSTFTPAQRFSNQYLGVVSNEQKINFFENDFVNPNNPFKATVDLVHQLHTTPDMLHQLTSSISGSTALGISPAEEVSEYWNTQTSDGVTILQILTKYPFIYSRNFTGGGIDASSYVELYEGVNSALYNNWTNANLEDIFSGAGFEMVSSASVLAMPYSDIDRFNQDNSAYSNTPIGYSSNRLVEEAEFGFPTFMSASEEAGTHHTMQNDGGKHVLLFNKGYLINPLIEQVLSNWPTASPTDVDSWVKFQIADVGSYNGGLAGGVGRGLPFTVNSTFVSGSSTLSTKARIVGAVFPEDIAINGTFQQGEYGEIVDDASFNGALEFNGAFSGDDINITERISATEIDTDISVSDQNAFKTVFGDETPAFRIDFRKETRFGKGAIRLGTTSGSLRTGSILKISGSGEISSSNYIQKPDGQVTGSKINFTGGRISGSDMSIFANEFEFKDDSGRGIIKGNQTTFEISSSLLNLTPTSLDLKGNLQAEQVYGQDTFLAGKVVNTGVRNPSIIGVKYSFPFVEVYSRQPHDTRLTSSVDFIPTGSHTVLAQTSSTIEGNHQRFTLSTNLHSKPQFLTRVTNDGVGYPDEFKSWKDISGVNNDYVFVSNTNASTAAQASASLDTELIGNQLVFNEATSSALIFNATNTLTASNDFQSITTDRIDLYDVLSEDRRNVHLQFAIRGTAHPSTGSFNGYNPEYKVEVLETSGSSVVWEKTYKDTSASHKNWAVFDIPMTDIATFYQQSIPYDTSTGSLEFNRQESPDNAGLKVRINMRYSGSKSMATRLTEGTRFGGSGQTVSGSFTLGFALTEMRMVEPVRATSIDTQTLHLKDTYMTWHDNPATTGHYGNFVPEFTSSATTSSFALGAPTEKWDEIYLNLKEDNQYPVETLVGEVSQSNKFVRINTHTGKLTFTSASAGGGGGGSSYTHPTHPGDDFSIDTGTLTGATVISDLDINVTTDTEGHVTDANGTVSTRTLTLANLGFTGDSDATNNTGTLTGNGSSGRIPIYSGTTSFTNGSTLTFTNGDLYVSDNTDNFANIGRTRIGYGAYSDYAWVSHRDLTSAGQYALLQSSVGDTFINAKDGRTLHFRINNSSVASITEAGLDLASGFTLDGNTISGIDDSGEFTNDDNHIMTSAAVEDKILGYGYGTGTLTGNGTSGDVPIYNGTTSFTTDAGLTFNTATETLSVTSVTTTGEIKTAYGTVSSPAIVFSSDTDTGIFGASGIWQVSVGGLQKLKVNADGLRIDDALGVNVNASTTDGRIDAGNDIVAYSTSDERLKENIKTIDSSLSKVLQIRGVEFDWKPLTEEEKKTIHGNEGHDVGVIAQEIEKVLPEVVTERDNGYKAVKYEKIVPLLIEAIKEQSDVIEKLTERINKLEKGSNN